MKVALRKENVRAWHEVEADFGDVEYRAVRDRQMRELEKEDDVMSKVPVRYVLVPRQEIETVKLTSMQEHARKALQRVVRVRAPAEDTLSHAGRVVHERDVARGEPVARHDS